MPNRTDPSVCLIAAGSNLGGRLEHLRFALDALANAPNITITSISGLYETSPVGGPHNQGAYYNAALRIESTLTAEHLLAFLHRIEDLRQRERSVRWGARTLDLDLLTYGQTISDKDTLMLPHPRMHERRFVMVPVHDVAPSLLHPQLGQSMQQLLSQLPTEPGDLKLVRRTWWRKEIEGHLP